MAEVAIERNIKDVGQLPLSEQVELQLDKKQRFLKIYHIASGCSFGEIISLITLVVTPYCTCNDTI
jgi:hypothetical protein